MQRAGRPVGARRWLTAIAFTAVGCGHVSANGESRLARSTDDASTLASPPDVEQDGTRDEVTPDAPRLETSVVEVAERVAPSVVSLRVGSWTLGSRLPPPFPLGSAAPPNDWRESWTFARGVGSGVIVRAEGYVLTADHVVEGASFIEAQLRDGRVLQGEVVGRDIATDLALIHIDASDLPAASFADPERVHVGQWVIALGAPFGLSYSVTAGVISATGRGGFGVNEIEDYLQTDASINPGSSGGPLVNLRGEVVGINTMMVGTSTGIGFAIPSQLAADVVDQILTTGVVHRAWLGLSVQRLTPELAERLGAPDASGALVSAVTPGAPAVAAGIRPGDIIVSLNGERLREDADLMRQLLRARVGEVVRLGVHRRGTPRDVELIAAQRPIDREALERPPAPPPALRRAEGAGADFIALRPRLAARLGYAPGRGLLVRQIIPGGASDRAGLEPGDVILEADGRPMRRPESLQLALRDGSALVRAVRRDGAFFTVLRIDGEP